VYLDSSCSIPIEVAARESRIERADGLFSSRRRAGRIGRAGDEVLVDHPFENEALDSTDEAFPFWDV
jgi:hypothetical protein